MMLHTLRVFNKFGEMLNVKRQWTHCVIDIGSCCNDMLLIMQLYDTYHTTYIQSTCIELLTTTMTLQQ
jgi:hypothetical protein